MKIVVNIVGAVFGLLFLAGGLVVLLGKAPEGQPMGPSAQKFMEVFAASGYLTFVKVCEVIGGVLVAVPKTRNLGLLVLGPIVINILAYHAFVVKGGFDWPHAFITIAALFLLWAERKAFAGLVNRKDEAP